MRRLRKIRTIKTITMLKKLFLFLLVAAPLSGFAQEKFAYINAQEVFAKMPEMKDVESKLMAKQAVMKKNMEAIEAEYTKKIEIFQKTPTDSITQSIALDRQKELEQLRERYQNFNEQSQAELQKEQETLLAPLHQKLVQAIKEVGDENNYTYIFDRSAMLYVNPSAIDASKAVKTKLNIKE